ncbi:Serpentine receptor [Trichinella spiralis]|uniref:Serpentine receptor n=1 Tax=Trichinella spiralis TaxID=6334 RepID=A0ABR3KW75_TRISP
MKFAFSIAYQLRLCLTFWSFYFVLSECSNAAHYFVSRKAVRQQKKVIIISALEMLMGDCFSEILKNQEGELVRIIMETTTCKWHPILLMLRRSNTFAHFAQLLKQFLPNYVFFFNGPSLVDIQLI